MTPREYEDREEGILEKMLESLKLIGQNVERLVYRLDFYNKGVGDKDSQGPRKR